MPNPVNVPANLQPTLSNTQLASKLVKQQLMPPGKMDRDLLSLSVADQGNGLFNFESDMVKRNPYGEANLFHQSGTVDLKQKLVSVLEDTFKHIIPR
ncbi:MAG TPA: hypothetical protein V6D47_06165 [Oscillatoriaceae cyanobacterium]